MPSSPNYNDNQFVIGPADIYLDVDLPPNNTKLELDATTGYPLTGRGLGYQEAGLTVTIAWERAPEEAVRNDYLKRISGDTDKNYRLWSITQMAISGRLVQARSMDRLEDILTAGNRETDVMFFGQAKAPKVSESCVVVWRVYPSGPVTTPVWAHCMIYSAVNRADFTLNLKSDAQAGLDFSFEAEPVYERAYGDRIGQLYMGTQP